MCPCPNLRKLGLEVGLVRQARGGRQEPAAPPDQDLGTGVAVRGCVRTGKAGGHTKGYDESYDGGVVVGLGYAAGSAERTTI